MIYFYARVSSAEQNLARQLERSNEYKVPDRIFSEKKSAESFNRPSYQEMRGLLTEGDEIVVTELDRLSRHKDELKEEIRWYKKKGVVLRVLDLPTTLQEFNGQNWIGELINDILIDVLSSFAEQERTKIKKRQREGIDAMPVVNGKRMSSKTGKPYGRPSIATCIDFEKFLEKTKRGELTVTSACKQLGIGRTTWYKLAREVG